jgi:hypothetical protein
MIHISQLINSWCDHKKFKLMIIKDAKIEGEIYEVEIVETNYGGKPDRKKFIYVIESGAHEMVKINVPLDAEFNKGDEFGQGVQISTGSINNRPYVSIKLADEGKD